MLNFELGGLRPKDGDCPRLPPLLPRLRNSELLVYPLHDTIIKRELPPADNGSNRRDTARLIAWAPELVHDRSVLFSQL